MKISDLAVKKPVTTVVFYLGIIVLGVFSLGKLAIDLIPDISYPVIAIFSEYPGVSPEEVEENLTKIIENSAASVSNVEKVSSTSQEGQSMVIVEFQWGTNMTEAAADLREQLDMVRDFLPDDASQPMIFKFDPSQIPIMVLTIEGKRDLKSLRYFAEHEIKTHLEQIDGVANVQIWGGEEREIHVDLNRTALASHGISVDQVVNILRLENLNITGGSVEEGSLLFSLRTVGKFENLTDIRKSIIATKNGIPVYLENLADIYDGYKEIDIEMRVGRNPAIIGIIQKQSGTNTVQVTGNVKKKINSLSLSLPEDINIKEIFTPSDFIEDSIANVGQVALLGGMLAIFVLFMFLRNLSITLIISVSIPLSIITTFIFMYFFDLTLNMMSLGGLALGVGMLVDNSIVVLENIFRYRENGAKPKEAAILGSQEMATPITASTMTTIAVFLPLVLFIHGLASELFKDLAFTVTFSLLSSLLVALTIIPMLSGRVKKIKIRQKIDSMRSVENELRARGKVLRFLDRRYSAILNLALKHRVITIVLILTIFAASLFLIPVVGVEFMPQTDEGQIDITVDAPVGSNLEQTRRVVNTIYDIVEEQVPEKRDTFVQIGRRGGGMGGEAANIGSVWLFLQDLEDRERGIEEIIDDLRERTTDIPGARIRFSTESHGGMGGSSGLTVSIKGYDLKQGKEIAQKMKAIMDDIEIVTDVRISREEGLPEYRILVDRKRAAQYGLTVAQVGNSIKRAFAGESVANVILGGEEVAINVRLKKEDRITHRDLNLIAIDTPIGVQVPLSNLVDIEKGYGPVKIAREGQQRVININANVRGDMKKVVDLIKKAARKITLPPGFTIIYGGSWEDLQKTLIDLAMVMLLALILVYLIMAAQFESFFDPFLIMFTVPMTITGVVWMHILTGSTFNAVSGIGVVMLTGIVVNNGIILVDYTNLLRKRDFDLLEAVKLGGRTRLRPILMTMLTTVLGLIPMAFATGSGSEMRTPMAQTVIGGLLVSTVFTLVLIPVLYASFEVRKQKRAAKRAIKKEKKRAMADAK